MPAFTSSAHRSFSVPAKSPRFATYATSPRRHFSIASSARISRLSSRARAASERPSPASTRPLHCCIMTRTMEPARAFRWCTACSRAERSGLPISKRCRRSDGPSSWSPSPRRERRCSGSRASMRGTRSTSWPQADSTRRLRRLFAPRPGSRDARRMGPGWAERPGSVDAVFERLVPSPFVSPARLYSRVDGGSFGSESVISYQGIRHRHQVDLLGTQE